MKKLLISIAVVLWLVPGVAFATDIQGIGGTEVLGSEINSGTLTKDTPYKITATEADHFGTGLIIGDYFVSDGTETCDANNKVQPVTSLPGAGIAFEDGTP